MDPRQRTIKKRLKAIFKIALTDNNIVPLADDEEHIRLFASACRENGYRLVYDINYHAYRMLRT